MIGFTGAPKIRYRDKDNEWVEIHLPHPDKGERIEDYDDSETKVFVNVNGKKIKGRKRERFVGEYKFGNASENLLTAMYDMYNATREIEFFPYSDVNYSIRCWIKVHKPRDLGIIQLEDLKISVESVDYIEQRLTSMDAIYACFMTTNSLIMNI